MFTPVDLIIMLDTICDIFNYADDNSAWYYAKSIVDVKKQLENVIKEILNWF